MLEILKNAMEASPSPTGWVIMSLGLLFFMASMLAIVTFAVTSRKDATVPILLAFAGMILVIVGGIVTYIAGL